MFNAAYPGKPTWYMQHGTYIFLYPLQDGFFYLLAGNLALVFWIIDLSARRQRAFCKAHPFKLITRQLSRIFHHGVADQVIIIFLPINDQVMRVKMKTIFLWEVR